MNPSTGDSSHLFKGSAHHHVTIPSALALKAELKISLLFMYINSLLYLGTVDLTSTTWPGKVFLSGSFHPVGVTINYSSVFCFASIMIVNDD